MLTQTSETAIKVLVYLVVNKPENPTAPKVFSDAFNASQSYMAKITGSLVKGGYLAAHRGVNGGVSLARSPENISLLDVIETCQGKLMGGFCQEFNDLDKVCSYHKIMLEVHNAVTGILAAHSISDLAEQPHPQLGDIVLRFPCKMTGVCLNDCSNQN